MLNLGRVTEGVACRDRTDAESDNDADEDTNTSNAAVVAIDYGTDTGGGQTRTHEKADMAVILAAYPGER